MVSVVIGAIALTGLALLRPARQWAVFASVRTWLDECGLPGISVPVVALVLATISVVVAGLVALLIPIPVMTPVAGLAGFVIPLAVLDASRTRRRNLAESQWPDIIDSIRMAVRSGAPLHESLSAAQNQVPREWMPTWQRAIEALARGVSVSAVFRQLRADSADPTTDRVCETILVAHELGGTELPRILEELGRGIRDDLRVRREATSRQSWVRHAARLGSTAPWIVVIMLGSQPENRVAFSSPAGASLLIACAGATVIAYTLMTTMGKLPTQPRWVVDD